MSATYTTGRFVFGIGSKTIGFVDEAKSAFSGENQPIEELVSDTINEAVEALNGAELRDVDIVVFKKGMAVSILAIAKGVRDGT